MRGALEHPFDAVVFDNDGLLLDTEHAWTSAEVTLFARRGLDFTPEHKREILGNTGRAVAAILERLLDAPGQGAMLVAEMAILALAEMGRSAPPRPGALELLARLDAAGIPFALASNSPRVMVDTALATAGIEQDRFVAILTPDVVEAPKPAPDLYIAACAALGTLPGRTVALEDSPTGVASAVAAGCFVIGVPSLEGIVLEQATMVAASLAAPEITRTLGL